MIVAPVAENRPLENHEHLATELHDASSESGPRSSVGTWPFQAKFLDENLVPEYLPELSISIMRRI